MDYPSETGYLLNNSRQRDNTVLILDSLLSSICFSVKFDDFEHRLSVSNVKSAIYQSLYMVFYFEES